MLGDGGAGAQVCKRAVAAALAGAFPVMPVSTCARARIIVTIKVLLTVRAFDCYFALFSSFSSLQHALLLSWYISM